MLIYILHLNIRQQHFIFLIFCLAFFVGFYSCTSSTSQKEMKFEVQNKLKDSIRNAMKDSLQAYAGTQEKLSNIVFINPKTYDFETAEKSSLIQHTFRFINNSETPLVIIDYSISCNCTDIYFSSRTIFPSDTGKVRLTLDPRNKAGFTKIYTCLITNTTEKYHKLSIQGFIN